VKKDSTATSGFRSRNGLEARRKLQILIKPNFWRTTSEASIQGDHATAP